jgi:F420-non-reducing hydrogenase iron-sulfur subunit
LRRYTLLKRVLAQFGIEEQRVQIVWASASEGPLLAETVNRMTEELRLLGPLRWHQKVLHNGHHPIQTPHVTDELPAVMEV